ncbi:MAG: bifunctional hydroxymethylpyrimidine kinase/phosphomethylpyrimidine kinase [Bacteroidales bacterium]|nr:bifunctional hydroxymethylpyrimidine kinase/phosphomethylpyrimidine kinase [Bacteroidales bacterium]
MSKKYNVVLSIAGSDPSGGAGIQADIKTISALGCYAATAVTSVVNENTTGVYGVHDIPADFVIGQANSVLDDLNVDAIKIGMLHSPDLAHAIAELLRQRKPQNVVLDPVMVATSGGDLMLQETLDVLRTELIPLATIITPNIPEAQTLLDGRQIKTVDDMKLAAEDLTELGPSVLLKGGHIEGDVLIDILCNVDTLQRLELPCDKIKTPNTHGTGCTLSSAIAANLAKGKPLTPAVIAAKEYINNAIAAGADYQIGHGHGPVCHFFSTLKYG